MRGPVAIAALLALAAGVAVGCAGAAPATAPSTAARTAPALTADVAIVDVTVIPMDRERELPHQTVLLHGDRVASVGESSAVVVPNGARTIDGRGLFLLPGLVDMHAHVDRASLGLQVSMGVTTVRNMAGRAKHLAWRERIARGVMVGPTIVTAGRVMDGSPPDYRGMAAITTRAEADVEVERQKRAGYDFVKLLQVLKPDAYDAVFAAARARGLRVIGHVPSEVPLVHALAMRQDSIEHLTGYFQAIQRDDSPYAKLDAKYDVHARVRMGDFVDDAKLKAIAVATRDAGVANCPTLMVSAPDVAATGAALARAREKEVTRFVSPAVRALWDPTKCAWSADMGEESDAAARKSVARRHIVKALHDAGALVLAGTDNPAFDVPGFALVDELAALVEAGLTPFEALAAATRDAQAFLHRGDAGQVAPGFVADLVLVSADPLRDVRNVERTAGVALRGRWFDEADLGALRDAAAARAIPRKNRLAGAVAGTPAAAREGSSPRVSWRIEVNGTEVGEERLVVDKLSGGGLRIGSQQSIDEPVGAEDVVVEAETDAAGEPQRLRMERRGDEEAGWLEVRRTGDRLAVRGVLPIDGEVAWERVAPRGVVLLAPTQASYALLARRVAGLAVGARMHLDALAFSMEGGPDDVELRLPVDATIEVLRFDARTFELEVAAANGRYHAELVVDGDGLPDTVTTDREEFEERRVRSTATP